MPARHARGATLYVTLEPCSHVGKSPPCVDAVIASGIARVVSAIEDPNPEVAGQGHARLRAAGIAVDVGLGAAEAARDHAGHFRRIRDRRPHVILKLAVSADDKIAAAGRKPVAITGEAARSRVHLLRAQCDAILVGIGTVLADDPLLNCRLPGMDGALAGAGGAGPRLADPGRQQARSFRAPDPAVGDDVGSRRSPGRRETRRGRRADVIHVAATANPPGLDLPAVLRALSEKGISRLMVEGGARVASSFIAAGLVDEVWLLRGPGNIGADGIPALDALPLSAITGSPAFKARASEMLDKDTLTIYERP